MAGDVGLAEIAPFEQKLRGTDHGDRIGETIAHVEPGRMAALAEAFERQFRRLVMLAIEGEGGDVRGSASAATMADALANPFDASTIRVSNRVGQPISTASSRTARLKASASGSSSAIATIADVSSAITGSGSPGRGSFGQPGRVVEVVVGGRRAGLDVGSALSGDLPDGVDRVGPRARSQFAVEPFERLLHEAVHRHAGSAGEGLRQGLGLGAADRELRFGQFSALRAWLRGTVGI